MNTLTNFSNATDKDIAKSSQHAIACNKKRLEKDTMIVKGNIITKYNTTFYNESRLSDGFYFEVKTELEAYQAAYGYGSFIRAPRPVKVEYSENICMWVVSVGRNEAKS